MKLVLLASLAALAYGHGYLADPVMRSSEWHDGFDNPINWTEDELNCGGFGEQWDLNDGKCGECGDQYDLPRPRANEAGGKYGNGIIVKEYTKGQVVDVGIELTTNHLGWFEFRLCPVNDPTVLVTQECLDENLLELADGSGNTRYMLEEQRIGRFVIPVKLPDDITCTQCVLQWWWNCGNNWGNCKNGTEGMGCGPQETWANCADIAII